jgi:uncharacterized protein
VSAIRYVSCPRCGAQVAWLSENVYRPFCSERCKLIDLGAWAPEQYRIGAAEQPAGTESGPDDNQSQ